MLLIDYQVRVVRVKLWDAFGLADLECEMLLALEFPNRDAIIGRVFTELEQTSSVHIILYKFF